MTTTIVHGAANDPSPYRDVWGNRYSTADAPHRAPGPLVHAPRDVWSAPKAFMAYKAGHHVVLTHDGNLTRTVRIGMVALALELSGAPVNPAVAELPADKRAEVYAQHSRMILGRYTNLEVTTTREPERADSVGYRTDTNGGGGYALDTFHSVTLAEVTAAAAKITATN